MLDTLPSRALDLVVQYLRSVDNNQIDPLHFSQVNRRLRIFAQRLVWEYFTISRVIKSHHRSYFPHILPYISRLQIANDTELNEAQWLKGLEFLEPLDWTRIRMVSVELDGFEGSCVGREAVRRIIGFAHERLSGVRELWVALSNDWEMVDLMLAKKQYAHVDELRIVGKALTKSLYDAVVIPPYTGLSAISLDGQSASMTTVTELVGRSQRTLRELNIEEYTVALATALCLHPDSAWAEFPQLRQLAISNEGSTEYSDVMIDGARLPAVEMLYFRETFYPLQSSGCNPVFDSTSVRLMYGVWAKLRLLVVDALSRGDIAVVGRQAPNLEVLRIGLLGSDVELSGDEEEPPAPALDLAAVSVLLQTCGRLLDLSIETPEAYEDFYNNHEGADPRLPWFERPFDTHAQIVGNGSLLRTLMLNAWALTFDQMLALFHSLPSLNSFEGNLKFNASYPATLRVASRHLCLAHLSLVHSTPTRHRKVFKSNLLRFVSMLPALRSLELYGSIDVPGVEAAVARVVPGCLAGFYALSVAPPPPPPPPLTFKP
ncbi:hypothetical protein GGH94_002687 [Coemansia aciculifera]|uniref:F-box domain-containing protein n=1 Tax=Coemansia aciculifera TaxID=417176 RepID=A0A9W8M3T5_9FUNG|nr:hypothetical protein GGH94_002687 [Coemansia aciculifera]